MDSTTKAILTVGGLGALAYIALAKRIPEEEEMIPEEEEISADITGITII